jgi:hypothetical protein
MSQIHNCFDCLSEDTKGTLAKNRENTMSRTITTIKSTITCLLLIGLAGMANAAAQDKLTDQQRITKSTKPDLSIYDGLYLDEMELLYIGSQKPKAAKPWYLGQAEPLSERLEPLPYIPGGAAYISNKPSEATLINENMR